MSENYNEPIEDGEAPEFVENAPKHVVGMEASSEPLSQTLKVIESILFEDLGDAFLPGTPARERFDEIVNGEQFQNLGPVLQKLAADRRDHRRNPITIESIYTALSLYVQTGSANNRVELATLLDGFSDEYEKGGLHKSERLVSKLQRFGRAAAAVFTGMLAHPAYGASDMPQASPVNNGAQKTASFSYDATTPAGIWRASDYENTDLEGGGNGNPEQELAAAVLERDSLKDQVAELRTELQGLDAKKTAYKAIMAKNVKGSSAWKGADAKLGPVRDRINTIILDLADLNGELVAAQANVDRWQTEVDRANATQNAAALAQAEIQRMNALETEVGTLVKPVPGVSNRYDTGLKSGEDAGQKASDALFNIQQRMGEIEQFVIENGLDVPLSRTDAEYALWSRLQTHLQTLQKQADNAQQWVDSSQKLAADQLGIATDSVAGVRADNAAAGQRKDELADAESRIKNAAALKKLTKPREFTKEDARNVKRNAKNAGDIRTAAEANMDAASMDATNALYGALMEKAQSGTLTLAELKELQDMLPKVETDPGLRLILEKIRDPKTGKKERMELLKMYAQQRRFLRPGEYFDVSGPGSSGTPGKKTSTTETKVKKGTQIITESYSGLPRDQVPLGFVQHDNNVRSGEYSANAADNYHVLSYAKYLGMSAAETKPTTAQGAMKNLYKAFTDPRTADDWYYTIREAWANKGRADSHTGSLKDADLRAHFDKAFSAMLKSPGSISAELARLGLKIGTTTGRVTLYGIENENGGVVRMINSRNVHPGEMFLMTTDGDIVGSLWCINPTIIIPTVSGERLREIVNTADTVTVTNNQYEELIKYRYIENTVIVQGQQQQSRVGVSGSANLHLDLVRIQNQKTGACFNVARNRLQQWSQGDSGDRGRPLNGNHSVGSDGDRGTGLGEQIGSDGDSGTGLGGHSNGNSGTPGNNPATRSNNKGPRN